MSGMRIEHDWPPNIDEIRAVLPVPKNVLFAWGDVIYNPYGIDVPGELIAHEEIHSNQQGGDPAKWWRRYLVDVRWRLSQELEAHRAEWAWVREHVTDRRERRFKLKQIAKRLSSPMYGSAISRAKAVKLIKDERR